jgi:hypothetical protein
MKAKEINQMLKYNEPKIQVIDEKLYDQVTDIDTSGLKRYKDYYTGTLSIYIGHEGWQDFTGEHGLNDYEDLGFRLEHKW